MDWKLQTESLSHLLHMATLSGVLIVLLNAFVAISYGATKEGAKNPFSLPQLLLYMWEWWYNSFFEGALTYIQVSSEMVFRLNKSTKKV